MSSGSGTKEKMGTVLLVDDEPDVREIIAMGISARGIDVLEAGNGQEALEVLREHRVDAIVSDLMMPRVSGLTLLNQLRESGATQPFIVVTGYSSQESTLQALRLGAFDYIEKPFETADLVAILTEAVRVGAALNKAMDSRRSKMDPTAEIQRLKALRFTEAQPAIDLTSRKSVHELLVSEAMPQLLFCEAAIRGLADPENRAFELGYLFRVMQALATAASLAGADELCQVAGTAALYYTTLRVRPRAVTPTSIDLATRANGTLQTLLANIGHQSASNSAEVIRDLANATAELETGIRNAG